MVGERDAASHCIQKDMGEELAAEIVRFMRSFRSGSATPGRRAYTFLQFQHPQFVNAGKILHVVRDHRKPACERLRRQHRIDDADRKSR